MVQVPKLKSKHYTIFITSFTLVYFSDVSKSWPYYSIDRWVIILNIYFKGTLRKGSKKITLIILCVCVFMYAKLLRPVL